MQKIAFVERFASQLPFGSVVTVEPKQPSPTECAHTGPHGCSQKSSNLDCLPLCRDLHVVFGVARKLVGQEFKAKVAAIS